MRTFVLDRTSVILAAGAILIGASAQAGSFKEPETVNEIIDALRPPAAASDPAAALGTTRGLNFSTGSGGGADEPAADQTGTGLASADFQILFEFNSSLLTTDAKQKLQKIGKALVSQDLSDFVFEIAGHTDAVGSAEYNSRLSKRRADAVVDYLVDSFGIERRRLTGEGYGESKLRNDSAPDSSENRRVEVKNLGSL